MDKVQIIRGSFVCFRLGLLSLIPVAGMVPAVLGAWRFFRVRAEVAENWNPASRELNFGFILSGIGLLISLFVLALIALAWLV